ncbi:response regulator [Granulicella tundricola]|uniref:Response regulator receiver protein n=1 Tax=Granulicella tundricola (strain ATCC BAA-1859 / DSM 23138 / MP5ACTX9) TaxID=1198114 RepID=E8X7N3_GRATM|nr:response regulator [Granulicella tundricola]ADW71467.1 response regulator receiver protein [Granulicella tundricola MP5ACTX9]
MAITSQPIAFVVDDERNIADTLAIILGKNGFVATPFYNPLLALSAAALGPPDLLISDVMMPELSGVDLVIRIRALCPNCRVLLFSGQADTTDFRLLARSAGGMSILAKPLHPERLLKEVWKQNPAWEAGSARMG